MKKIEKNNVTIALNILCAKKEKKYLAFVLNHAYISKHNLNREKQVILLMISNRKSWLILQRPNITVTFIVGIAFIPKSKCVKDKKYCKVKSHCFYTRKYGGAAHRICNLKYSVHKNSYDYHFILKEIAEEFKRQFTCLGENIEKYMTFTVPIEQKIARINKYGEEITKNIFYISQFIASSRFMANSLSNLANNLSGGIFKTKCM